MKKILVGISLVLVALVIFGAGFVFAQSQTVFAAPLAQGIGPGGMMGGRGGGMMGGRGGMMGGGQMHDYVEQALADKLGMSEADVETQFSSGKSMYQIALDKGIAENDVPALLAEVHKTAFDKAVADGLMTQAQADAMLANMQANGFNPANCPMGGAGNQGGAGRGGMMGGGRWNRNSQTNP